MNNDLISREALKEDLRRFFPAEVLEGIEPKTLFAQIMHDIDNAPTVELTENSAIQYSLGYQDGFLEGKKMNERPQGEWIVYDNDDPIKFCKCSLCGRYEEIINFKNYPYCHCGAKMKGGAE